MLTSPSHKPKRTIPLTAVAQQRRDIEAEAKAEAKAEEANAEAEKQTTNESNYFEKLKVERAAREPFNGKASAAATMLDPKKHLSVCSLIAPLPVLALFMNLATTEQNSRCLPVYLNQPEVNNRKIKVENVYDRSKAETATTKRDTKDFGTIETAWNHSGLTMSAGKAVVSFYEVHSDGLTPGMQQAELKPCLDSYDENTILVGRPYAAKLRLESSKALFFFFTDIKAEDAFKDDFSAEDRDDDSLAYRLVCTTMEVISSRFDGLNSDSNWFELYTFLRQRMSFHLRERGSDVNSKQESILSQLPLVPETEVVTRKLCWLLVNAITPIRNAILDGQRRLAGVIYAILNRLPETSIKELLDSLDPLKSKESLLVTPNNPDWNIVSDWVSIDAVRPSVAEQSEDVFLGSIEMSILTRYSETIQMDNTSARERTFPDSFRSLLKSLETNPSYRSTLLVPGELYWRPKKKGDKSPASWPKNDDLKNRQAHNNLWDFVVSRLYTETAESVRSMIVSASESISKTNTEFSDNADSFVKVNREGLDNDKIKGVSFKKDPLSVRVDINSIAKLVCDFVGGVKSMIHLVNLLTLKTGNEVPGLMDKQTPLTNLNGQVPGAPDGAFIVTVSVVCMFSAKKFGYGYLNFLSK